MKRVSKLFALLIAALSVALVSCNKDGSSDNFYVSYGVIVGTQDAYTIKTDGGNTLTVIENMVPSFPVVDGMRVRVNYTIEKQTANGFEVRLNAIEKILSKDPVYSTKLTPEELTALGNDPIDVEDAWFGGNYLNVNFFVFRFDPSLAHFINLLVDEQNSMWWLSSSTTLMEIRRLRSLSAACRLTSAVWFRPGRNRSRLRSNGPITTT